MSLWEESGRRHGLTAESGFLLGGEAQGIADVVTATLWSTMADRFPKIAAMLEEAAPMTAALTRRIADLPALAKLAAKAKQDYGNAYCGGQIEASLRKVLKRLSFWMGGRRWLASIRLRPAPLTTVRELLSHDAGRRREQRCRDPCRRKPARQSWTAPLPQDAFQSWPPPPRKAVRASAAATTLAVGCCADSGLARVAGPVFAADAVDDWGNA